MAKLVLSLDGVVLKEHDLTKERTTIGRKPHNDIQIDNLAISGEHAVIVTILNDSFLQDLDSTNGTQVNGRPVKKHFLQDKDTIEMAKYKIQYSSCAAAPANTENYQETLVLRSEDEAPAGSHARANNSQGSSLVSRPAPPTSEPEPKKEEVTTGLQKPVGSATGLQKAVGTKTGLPGSSGTRTGFRGSAGIQFLTGSGAGREIEISKNLTTLGKPGSHLAVIARRKNGYFLTHVEGDAFPLINGKSLDAKAHPLASHDIIELGGVKMEFFINS